MKKIVYVITGLLLVTGQVFAQKNKKEKEKQPDEKIIVNKKYDENGNLIQFDSTYVHKWSSDSTFQSSYPDDQFFKGKDFPDIDQFLKDLMNDSIKGMHHGFAPFDHDEFLKQFGEAFPDSLMQNFSFQHDSTYFDFPMDSLKNLPPGFMPNFDELMQGLQDHLGTMPDQFLDMPPKFQSQEQQKEWQQLMEKQRKEMEEFRKKWDQKNKDSQKL